MDSKKMTHTGMVNTRGSEPIEKWLRETPKFWTDGELQWAKLNKQGKPNDLAWVWAKHSYMTHFLDLTTIRPLTPTDLRVPLQEAVSYKRYYIVRLENELRSIKIRLVSAIDERDEAEKELATFDEKHPEVKKEIEETDEAAGTTST